MTAKEIRQAFLDFFAAKGHIIVPSAPIVVKNDPTLMFTNAGMNQFKDVFLGEAPAKAPRVADTQRCLRVSGKHNDLEEVGIDTYHHTMFEMLGNWSFGDYFKKDAIAWSWELLTEVYKLDKDRLYVTYFEGDEKEGLEKDTETYDLWKQYVDEAHILPGNKKDNFWEMGETGPCGPCSEIHFDSRPDNERAEKSGADWVNADHHQVIEIWNNVFMQFNRIKDGSLHSLPAKHVDTGMGFERLVRVLQGKSSNYDSDVFQPMIQFIAEKSGKKYNSAAKPGDADWADAVAMRVLSDHIRAISFAIADGQLPASNKAGYVIRRILRRAVRYSYQTLHFKEPFFNELVPLLAEQFKGVFDELYNQKDFVQKVIREEEVSFLKTLGNGIYLFEDYLENPEKSMAYVVHDHVENTKAKTIPGGFAFVLSDTYGFPIDLTELMARERGWDVDMEGFEKALQEQKTRSRAATAIDTGDWVVLKDDDNVEFTGYDETESIAHIIKYRKVTAKGKEQYQIVLDKTPFYAESGGQVGDTGELVFPNGEIIEVTDTKKENGLIVHFTDKIPSTPDDALTAIVDATKRNSIENNHSATHLLHAAMKQVLGTHVNQKGSLVNAGYLRFDFSHFAKVTEEEIAQIETIVNGKIRENIQLKEERMVAYQEAISSGVTALFGEKYGDYVRVITFDDSFSKELCGGTHVKATGQIGYFKIIAESAVAAGVRRIEAITGTAAEDFITEQTKLVQQVKDLLKNPKDVAKSIEALLEENNRLKKEIEKSVLEKSSGLKDELAKTAENINGINFIAQKVALPNADAIKNLAYNLKDIVPNLFLVLAADINGKPSITVMIDEALVKEKGLHAGNIVKELAKEVKGGGGGQPFFATAGGSDLSGIDNALAKAKTFIP
ncbi:alanine--tRNA ligase [Mucilaginibacter phyllosphaerae]|uniref:Alanine--tRNA ligase n=1 Tax=Mucilaginibacter phyllosphaerae TaxID=1812349 RepID=A0A4Y8AIC5_9SPHI|nr:alanine--tRNA ligase [Mucilaginibacter phyllosphaerae]MBB3968162.1 alanyl-tRNA synthetase [Mucilaginibacter phyllosphaerae]TEW68823.1 alanine--tRNA ligase [Mucilaginibacter phyllosphaerae]GGH00826.1 alanine--tRNA ligase [Mucilaginibacter phyllosphaerae]